MKCYHAETDGWDSTTFHSKCDGKGPTVSIIQVSNYTFGGHTDVSWQSMHFLSVTYYSPGRGWLDKWYPLFGTKVCTDIFRRHCVFQDSQNFSRANLQENCERGTDIVQGQISVHIVVPNRSSCVYHPSSILQRAWKDVHEWLTVCCLISYTTLWIK